MAIVMRLLTPKAGVLLASCGRGSTFIVGKTGKKEITPNLVISVVLFESRFA
jgi:hypothetical protein